MDTEPRRRMGLLVEQTAVQLVGYQALHGHIVDKEHLDLLTSSAVVALVCSHAILASVVNPFGTSSLSRSECLDFVTSIVIVASAWKRADHFRCDGLGHIISQLFLFSIILNHEATSSLFIDVFSTYPAYLEHDPEKDFFRAACPVKTMLSWISDVAAGDISGAIDGKGNAVGDLLTPACHVELVKSFKTD
jgi:hypothetical protein